MITFSEIEAELRRAFPVIPRMDAYPVRIRAYAIDGHSLWLAWESGGVGAIVEKFKSELPSDAILTEAPTLDGQTLLYAKQMQNIYFILVQSDHFPIVSPEESFESEHIR